MRNKKTFENDRRVGMGKKTIEERFENMNVKKQQLPLVFQILSSPLETELIFCIFIIYSEKVFFIPNNHLLF